ncbi:ankyrin repeat-containing domain protein [Fennellomyces sp. T-0311]|nr:ankyrin repeat-containing domain protein [Fennellomyces sp. T-0311]
MPPATAAAISTSSSLSSIDENSSKFDALSDVKVIRSAKETLIELLTQVEAPDLRRAMKNEIKRLVTDHDRLVTVLQQRSRLLEHENDELKVISTEHQRRYEKAVREMQFFRRKYDKVAELHKQQQTTRPRSLSIGSESSGDNQQPQQQQKLQSYPLTPTSPQPSSLPHAMAEATSYDVGPTDILPPTPRNNKPTMPSRSSSTSTSSSSSVAQQFWPGTMAIPGPPAEPAPPVPRLRQNSIATSVHSAQSSSTDGQSSSQQSQKQQDGNPRRKRSWQSNQQGQPIQQTGSSSTSTSTATAPPSSPSNNTASSPSASAPPHSVPMTPVRSSTATNGYTGASLIQQRRVDPLIFGGSDGLWETIAKSKGSDVTVEKIISNFLRRGGSPNTAKQSPSANAVKYGYGMIHALIVTKAPGSLDLLLQQGANPNVMTLSQIEDDKVTPCYLAASVGWLTGLQKLVQAGGDLMAARGAGVKNKTVLHVAAEHCHAAVVEYIVNVTQGGLNLEEDSNGATVLHYACASGHTDLVSFLARSCQIPVNQPDHRGELPLHWAARHGRLEVVTLLVERCGCDFNAYVPRKVGTPLDLAKAGGQRRLVDYLKGLGAMTGKKMDKRREEELTREVPKHLESTLARNGLFLGDDL